MLRLLPLSLLLLVALAIPPAAAGEANPDDVPRIGKIAPALGLYAFEKKERGDEERTAVQLDHFCGLRAGDTNAVLLLFVDANGMADLKIADDWMRSYRAQGLRVLAISTEAAPVDFAAEVIKAGLRFPVLDDRQGVVARRFGVRQPFTFLLDRDCRVLGFSDRTLSQDQAALPAAIQQTLESGAAAPRFDTRTAAPKE